MEPITNVEKEKGNGENNESFAIHMFLIPSKQLFMRFTIFGFFWRIWSIVRRRTGVVMTVTVMTTPVFDVTGGADSHRSVCKGQSFILKYMRPFYDF